MAIVVSIIFSKNGRDGEGEKRRKREREKGRRGEGEKGRRREREKGRRGEGKIYPIYLGIFFHLQWITVYAKANKWCPQNLY